MSTNLILAIGGLLITIIGGLCGGAMAWQRTQSQMRSLTEKYLHLEAQLNSLNSKSAANDINYVTVANALQVLQISIDKVEDRLTKISLAACECPMLSRRKHEDV